MPDFCRIDFVIKGQAKNLPFYVPLVLFLKDVCFKLD